MNSLKLKEITAMVAKCLHFKKNQGSQLLFYTADSNIELQVFDIVHILNLKAHPVSFHSSEASTDSQKHVPLIQTPWPVIQDGPLLVLFIAT